MHQNMSIVSPFMASARTGSAQQGSSSLGALAGLFGMDGAGQGGGVSFGKQLALVIQAAPGQHNNGQHMNGDGTSAMNMAGTAQSTEGGTMPLPLLQNGPMSGKGVMLAALKGGMNMAGLDSDLVASIRSQILTAAQNGEISLPPAWSNALERGAVIHPVFGEEAPDPVELTDIMAALGLITNGEIPLPANTGAEGPGFGLGVASGHTPETFSGAAPVSSLTGQRASDNSLKAVSNGPLPGPVETIPGDTPDQGMNLKGGPADNQTLNGQAKSTQAAGATPVTPADPALTARGVAANEAAASQARPSDAANSANTSQAAGQNGAGAGTAATGNGSNTGSNGQGGDNNSATGTADNQNRATSPSNGADRGGHPFLARLETMLESHGLTVGSPLAQTAGLTGTEDDALAQAMNGIQTSLNSNQTASPATATGTTPAMTSWSPVAGQVAVQISKQAKEGAQEFTIRLDPPELGRINVKLDIAHDGKVNAVISVDNEKTLHLLQRDQSQLERALADAGLQTDSGSLNFSMSGNDDSGKDNGMGADGGIPNSSAMAVEATETESGNTAADTLMVSDRPLDIMV